MYNRYIPQADGSYRRNRVQDNVPPPPEPSRVEPVQDHCPPPEPEPCRETPSSNPRPQQRYQRQNPPPRQNQRTQRQEHKDGSVLNFLRQLLPKDFDTGDLLVVVLLLLMSADCADDQNTALLTLALYLFM